MAASGATSDLEECRIIAVGKNGNGKSTIGNNFLGNRNFASLCSAKAVTENCQCDSATRYGKRLVYVDTPGFFDIEKSNEIIQKEIIKCIALSSPGPHAFLWIIKIDRLTPEEKNTIDLCGQIFGDEFYKHLIVVFTHKDKLHKSGKSLQQFISEAPFELQNVLKRNNNICIAIENEASPEEVEEQMKELFTLVTVVVRNNQGKFYTNRMYANIEEKLLKQEETERKSRVENLATSMRDKKTSIWKFRKDDREEKELLQALVTNIESNPEISSMEEAQLVEASINQHAIEIEKLKYDIIRMEQELDRLKKESRQHPHKPGWFRQNIRKMIQSEEGHIVLNFLKEHGLTILKLGIDLFKFYRKI